MRVLVVCERSGVIRQAFRDLGHDAWSCDLAPAEDGSDYHFEMDARDLLALGMEWDLMIAHPDCRRLCNSGVLRLYRAGKKCNGKDTVKWREMREAAEFFRFLLDQHKRIPRICIENPVMHRHAATIIGMRHTQTVQPWQFGEDASKRTCLWLIDLEKLKPTKVIRKKRYANQTPSGQNRLGPSPERSMDRARTYRGIAGAMAEQWGGGRV